MQQHTNDQKAEINRIFSMQRVHAAKLKNSTASDRIAKLNAIKGYMMDPQNRGRLCDALHHDLRKAKTETLSAEYAVIINTLNHIKRHLKGWMKDKVVPTPITLMGSKSFIRHEPKGCALIIAPWNYPFQLAINPLLYAIAGGCTVMLKPSEFSTATAQYLEDMLHHLFDAQEVCVFQGAVETSQHLLELPFDHMYFTGSPAVGKIVMTSAAIHLSSVTLELGGKSPCVIDPITDIKVAAQKLAWGKFYNNGQTCIAPDHVYVHESKVESLVTNLREAIRKMYDPNQKGIQLSTDYGRIISDRHFDRAVAMLQDATNKGAQLLHGGRFDREDLYLEPTFVTNVHSDMKVMQEEIFNPILPIISYSNIEEVVQDILTRPKPLAMYILSSNKSFYNYFLDNTSAGSTVINYMMIQYANHELPFGGVNNSGIGKSHSYHGFLEFTNQRSVMRYRWGLVSLLSPPFSKRSESLAQLIARYIS